MVVTRTLFLDVRGQSQFDTDSMLNTVRYVDGGKIEPIVACRAHSAQERAYRAIRGVNVLALTLPSALPAEDAAWPVAVWQRLHASTRMALAARALARAVRDLRIDTIYCPAEPMAMALLEWVRRFVKTPVALHARRAYDGSRAYYHAVRHASAVIADCRHTAESLRVVLEDVVPLETIYDGQLLPTPGADSDLIRWHMGIDAEQCCVVIVGQADRPDWISNFFAEAHDILRESPQCLFLFADTETKAGHTQRAERIHALAAKYGLAGYVRVLDASTSLYPALAVGNMAVVPAWRAESGSFILQAFAHRKPVIGCVAGGTQELLQNASGYLLPPRDFVNLADAIIQLAEGDSLRESLAGRGYRRFLECFHFSRFLTDLTTVLLYAAKTRAAHAATAADQADAASSSEEPVVY